MNWDAIGMDVPWCVHVGCLRAAQHKINPRLWAVAFAKGAR